MDSTFTKQAFKNGDVYIADAINFRLTKDNVSNLIDQAQDAPRQRARICAHRRPDEAVHEMFIAHHKTAYVRPHKHREKTESILILVGEVDYLIFDESGNVSECYRLSDYSSGLSFYHTTRMALYHSLIVRSEWVVFLEITKGPFDPEDTVWAKWSPSEDDIDLPKFQEKLELEVIRISAG